jgi:hypothetical protein
LFAEEIGMRALAQDEVRSLAADDGRVSDVFDAGLPRRGDHVVMLGVAVGKAEGGDKHHLLNAHEGIQQRAIVKVVALANLDALSGKIGRLFWVAG